MQAVVFDIECNGLYTDVTEIHCIVIGSYNKGIYQYHKYYGNKGLNSIEEGLIHLANSKILIGHNIIDYDLRVIKKLYNSQYPELIKKLDNKKTIIDTYLLSNMLFPDLKRHPKCPPSKVTISGRKIIGPHSLENWGYYLNMGKVDYEDWTIFTKEMLERCVQDVRITSELANKIGILKNIK